MFATPCRCRYSLCGCVWVRAYVFVCVHILQRRNSLLAITSSLMGAAAFVKSRTEKDSDGDLTDAVATLKSLESKSPSLQAAIKSGRPTFVEFWGQNCPNCKAMAPVTALPEYKHAYLHHLAYTHRHTTDTHTHTNACPQTDLHARVYMWTSRVPPAPLFLLRRLP